jgi:hypothetical protein
MCMHQRHIRPSLRVLRVFVDRSEKRASVRRGGRCLRLRYRELRPPANRRQNKPVRIVQSLSCRG